MYFILVANPLRVWCFLNPHPGDKNFYIALCNALHVNPQFVELDERGDRNGITDPFKLLPLPPYPDIALSASTQLGAFALRALKIRNPSTFTVHFFTPPGSFKHFDLVCCPCGSPETDSKIIRTTGVLTPHLPSLESRENLLGVFIGGIRKFDKDTEKRLYGLEDIDPEDLCSKIETLSRKLGLPVQVATSPRTPSRISNILKAYFKEAVWTWEERMVRQNPYSSLLKRARAFLVTADSLSMISEACVSNQPVYIYDLNEAMQEKARTQFFVTLLEEGRIQNLHEGTDWFSPPATPLNEASRIAELIQERMQMPRLHRHTADQPRHRPHQSIRVPTI